MTWLNVQEGLRRGWVRLQRPRAALLLSGGNLREEGLSASLYFQVKSVKVKSKKVSLNSVFWHFSIVLAGECLGKEGGVFSSAWWCVINSFSSAEMETGDSDDQKATSFTTASEDLWKCVPYCV